MVGALANQQWSITGWSATEVNQLLILPFLKLLPAPLPALTFAGTRA